MTEPVRGTDFIRQFWVNANAANSDPNTPQAMRDTIRDFDNGLSLEEAFHRFSIANIARHRLIERVLDRRERPCRQPLPE